MRVDALVTDKGQPVRGTTTKELVFVSCFRVFVVPLSKGLRDDTFVECYSSAALIFRADQRFIGGFR